MRKNFLLILIYLFAGIVGVNAQITIGADDAPHSGAVLDLRSDTTTGKGKGLKLPVVKIEDASKFQLSADASTAEGILVYNSNHATTGGHGKGLYVWNGSAWQLIAPSIPVSGITLNETTLSFTTTATKTLTATIDYPTYSADNSVIWSTNDASVATVSNGVITPHGNGTAIITATSTDGSKSATCTVTVNIPASAPVISVALAKIN